MEKAVFTKSEIEELIPPSYALCRKRNSLQNPLLLNLEKIVKKAKAFGYSNEELYNAWKKALNKKYCDEAPAEKENLDFENALSIYFKNISCYEMGFYGSVIEYILRDFE